MSCESKKASETKNCSSQFPFAKKISNSDKLSVLDTTIMLSGIPISKYHGADLTDSLAKVILYSYYKKKGYFNSDNFPDLGKLTDKETDELVVDYDTMFVINMNDNEHIDAVITFWITPPGANGQCWQPHKAIIVDADDGYKITNEEFIPTNFAIDSIVKLNGQLVLFGSDYDCADHKTLRALRITLIK
jgi:hypothetical protein